MYKLVLMRHGESIWNAENRFTGWADIDLTEAGKIQASCAGQLLKKEGYEFDVAYSSMLKRAIRTLWIVLDVMNIMYTPTNLSWRLNERHYGQLQGLNKAKTAAKFGEDKVLIWRRSYDIAPDSLLFDDERHPRFDTRYKNIASSLLPSSECLKDTVDRVVPFWNNHILPVIKEGKNVFIVAHGNSLRALIKHIGAISDKDIMCLNIPTGQPMVCELDREFNLTEYHYLGDPSDIEMAVSAITSQGKK
ncbi:2,3-diphosphoglycerate-dependent phosphoglycerate mutase [Candidatus Kinetoplastidibacterium galati]|uniref:2,3-bisphosphoglycerate-dependent phosphoglycerate mutase n=1 Tax=Candidatus Kinetoplastidibacterium galati TCC219 TaxID=1208921 RepID=M1LUW3_9PROT|nr:2,3-diphosphoglycerate-dependent phosphoglycerate mutase [Candidatus Kinetoplastibacterium galatii]AGF49332.1 phosphoglycerate mutase [Candidatus Kinetoplastibacterium galatii TCC219]